MISGKGSGMFGWVTGLGSNVSGGFSRRFMILQYLQVPELCAAQHLHFCKSSMGHSKTPQCPRRLR